MSYRRNFILIWYDFKQNRFYYLSDVDLYIQNVELYRHFTQTHNSEKGEFEKFYVQTAMCILGDKTPHSPHGE